MKIRPYYHYHQDDPTEHIIGGISFPQSEVGALCEQLDLTMRAIILYLI